jgi:death-on-curing protein
MTKPLEFLAVEEVLRIHEVLIADFVQSKDPIFPPGVRSMALLESAVGRQSVGHGGRLKYPDAISNAATLVFGICMDHPFHNGNKRTALVAMLGHLDRNGLCLYGTTQADVYRFMLSIADHSIGLRHDSRRKDKTPTRRSADEEVKAIAEWLAKRVQEVRRGEKPITYRHLRQALAAFQYELGTIDSNRVEVVKVETEKPTLLRRHPRTVRKRVGWIGYRNEGTEVSIKDLKAVRRMCKLTEADGVDTDAFYNHSAVVDSFINQYRTVLRRLAKT